MEFRWGFGLQCVLAYWNWCYQVIVWNNIIACPPAILLKLYLVQFWIAGIENSAYQWWTDTHPTPLSCIFPPSGQYLQGYRSPEDPLYCWWVKHCSMFSAQYWWVQLVSIREDVRCQLWIIVCLTRKSLRCKCSVQVLSWNYICHNFYAYLALSHVFCCRVRLDTSGLI